MNKQNNIALALALLLSASTACAQSPAVAKANADGAACVSQASAGNSNASMYESLFAAYRTYLYVVKNNANDRDGLDGLRKVYPYMIDGAVYFSQQNQAVKALDSAWA